VYLIRSRSLQCAFASVAAPAVALRMRCKSSRHNNLWTNPTALRARPASKEDVISSFSPAIELLIFMAAPPSSAILNENPPLSLRSTSSGCCPMARLSYLWWSRTSSRCAAVALLSLNDAPRQHRLTESRGHRFVMPCRMIERRCSMSAASLSEGLTKVCSMTAPRRVSNSALPSTSWRTNPSAFPRSINRT
jgi:hypothetical protein